MAYVPKLYLETTVLNFYFTEKESKKRQYTHMLFEEIKKGKYEVFSSRYVYNEISKDIPMKYRKMLGLIDKYVLKILEYDQKVFDLAEKYVKNGIIPVKYITDARHIASASVNQLVYVPPRR